MFYLVFTIGIPSIDPYIGCPISLVHCLVNNVCTVLYIALFSTGSFGGTNADVELQTVFGCKVVIPMVQIILILFFLDHNLRKNPKSKNSFKTCESQFEKYCPNVFQVVIYLFIFKSRITEGIGQSFVIAAIRVCDH